MSSADHTNYDVIFVGGTDPLDFAMSELCCADNGFRRSYCLRYCRSSC